MTALGHASPATRLPVLSADLGVAKTVVTRDIELPGHLADGVDPAVMLAAHAKVLSVMTGEREVVTGLREVPGEDALPCRLSVAPGSWRELVARARQTRQLPAADRETLAAPLFESVLDLTGSPEPGIGPDTTTTLVIGLSPDTTRRVLRLWYRADAVDHDHAARLAGYHLRALSSIAADPAAAHHRQSLLSDQELSLQLHGMAGRRVALPDRRYHDLFADQARATPGAIAVHHEGREWTYGDLDARANRMANGLLGRGLKREDVVAVACKRGFDWIAAIIAIFKAGGVYLPVDPSFPAGRIGRMLSRSECRFALVDRQGADSLRRIDGSAHDVPPPEVITFDEAAEADATAPDVLVDAGQPAYIYFTSGSTGQPKGAMCEHAGMLNHLLAKVHDLGIGAHDVVVQNAPQCFDISLWQLIAPLMVGGRTVLVGDDAIRDCRRFVDEIATAGATVLQVVPSYLEMLLSYLDDEPRELGPLRNVSVTGEAIKKELVQRWFARHDIPLINGYGATEASDDTTHEVMHGVPVQDLVPVGRPVQNVHVYVVDENLALVPLGAPGEVVFSGVCVGRGYVNDTERTRMAFVDDPYQPGQRMYRTGDFGRWLPGGGLEFLGRRDEQVKIRGFRIEIGEIEDRLTRLPGVRDAAVVVEDGTGRSKNLVAFYVATRQVSASALREFLTGALPDYMVPLYFHRLDALPLTDNGKVDKKALAGLAASLGHGGAPYAAPRTPSERRIATVWAEVLEIGLEKIGRADHFFDLGGSSLSAVRLVVKLDRALSLNDLTGTPVLADLAALLDGRTARSSDLLHPLSARSAGSVAALVCFPYAGGNAVNCQPLARALEGSGFAVYGVELPGHDLGSDSDSLLGTAEVAERVADEIERRIDTPVVLFGHDTGAVTALAVARLLGERADLRRVFLAGALLADDATLHAGIAETNRLSDQDVTALLSAANAYVELDGAREERTDLVGDAYRHDRTSAATYLLDAPRTTRLAAPVTVMVTDDDPLTEGYETAYRTWSAFADEVELCQLSGGGHYFPRTRAVDVAHAVLRTIELAEFVGDGGNRRDRPA